MRKILFGTFVALTLVALSGNPLAINYMASTPLITKAYAESTQFIGSERGDTWEKQYYQNGANVLVYHTFGLPEFIDTPQGYKAYSITNTPTHINVNSNITPLSFDKSDCTNEIYHKDGSGTFIQDEYWSVVTNSGSGWKLYDILQLGCDYTTGNSNDGKTLTVHREHPKAQFFSQYTLNDDGSLTKPELTLVNNGAYQNATFSGNGTQITPEVMGGFENLKVSFANVWKGVSASSISFDGTTYSGQDLANLLPNGQAVTLRKAQLVDKIINFETSEGNTFIYDTTLGYNDLVALQITRNGATADIVWVYGKPQNINLGEVITLDPTFGYAAGTDYHAIDRSGVSSASCTKGTLVKSTVESLSLYKRNSGSGANDNCIIEAIMWDISSIDDTSIITDVSLRYDIDSAINAQNCDYTSIEGEPSTQSATDLWNDIDGTDTTTTTFVSNDSGCASTGTDKTLDLGVNADSDLQAELLVDDTWGIGRLFTDMTRDGSDRRSDRTNGDYELQVTYIMPIVPLAPTNDGVTNVGADLQYDWTFGTNFNNATQPSIDSSTVYVGNTKYQYTPLANWNATQETDIGGITTSSNFEGLFHFDSINYFGTITEENTSGGSYSELGGSSNDKLKLAEHITSSGSLVGKTITEITVSLKDTIGSPTGTIYARNWDSSDTIKNTCTDTLDASTVTGTFADYTFTGCNFEIESGDRFGLQCDGCDASNKVGWERSTSNTYDGTNSVMATHNGASWSDSTGFDFVFSVEYNDENNSGFYDYSGNDDHAEIMNPIDTITFDNSATNSVFSPQGSSLTISSFTVADNANKILIVSTGTYNGSPTVSGVTWNGASESFTKAVSLAGNYDVEIWYLVNPTATTDDVVVTFSDSTAGNRGAGVYSFYNVDQTSPIGVTNTVVGGTTTSPNGTITPTTEGSMIVDSFYNGCGTVSGVTVDHTEGWTQLTGGTDRIFSSQYDLDPTIGSSNDIGRDGTCSTSYSMVIAEIKPSSGSATIKSSHIDTGLSNEIQLSNAGLNVTSSEWGISGTGDWSINSIVTLNQTDPFTFLSFDSGSEVKITLDNEFIDLTKGGSTIFNHTFTTPLTSTAYVGADYTNDFNTDDGTQTGTVYSVDTATDEELDGASDRTATNHNYTFDLQTLLGESVGDTWGYRFTFDGTCSSGSNSAFTFVMITDGDATRNGHTSGAQKGIGFDTVNCDLQGIIQDAQTPISSLTGTVSGSISDSTTYYVQITSESTDDINVCVSTSDSHSCDVLDSDISHASFSVALRYLKFQNWTIAPAGSMGSWTQQFDNIEFCNNSINFDTCNPYTLSPPQALTITRDTSGNYETLINGTESVTSTDATTLGTVTNDLYHIGFDTSLGNSGTWRLDELSIRSDEQTAQDSADFGERIQPFTYQASVTAPTTTYTHTGFVGATDSCFKVTAWNSVGESTASGIECGTASDPSPTQPTGLLATDISESRIDLSWDTAPVYDNITGYRIFYESPVGNGWIKLVNDTGTSTVTYSHTSLSTKTQYNYMVAGINATGVGSNSTASNTYTWGVPDAPTGFSIINPTVDTLNLNYTASVPFGYPVTGYEVYRDNVQISADIGNVTSYTDTGLGAVTSYDYAVRALSSFGSSGWANATGTTVTEPPTSLTVNDCYHTCTTQLNLEWVAPVPDTGVNGYKIETESPIGGGWSTLVANTTTTTLYYNHTGLANDGVFHNYRIYALTPDGQSAVSNTYAYTTHKLPDSITDLVVTDDGLLQFVLNWSVPSNLYGTLSGYMINYTTPAGDPLTIETSDTGSTSTTYTKAGNDPTVEYSFRVSAVTNHGTNSTLGNIFNYTLTTPLEVGDLTFSTEDNTNVVPYSYMVIPVSDTTDTIRVTFDSSFTTDCTIEQTLAGTTNSYTGLSETAGSGSSVYHDFSVQNTGNDVLEFDCWDQTDPTQNGQFLFTIDQTGLTSTAMPLVGQVQNFTGGLYGTNGEFGEFDLITLFVIILSMLGFNRKHPALGVGFMVVALGATRYYGLIGDISLAVGGIALISVLAIGVGLKKY